MLTALAKLRAMDREELRFRLGSGLRKWGGRTRAAISPVQWHRKDLRRILRDALPERSADFQSGREALVSGDWMAAHRSLAAHFSTRHPTFPLDPRGLSGLAGRVALSFPEAAAEASRRASLILEGRYDILGYRNVSFGSPPRWHFDPVHQRTAPGGFWSTVPYLRPESGDHKVIWEINRHQHWLALARAWHLTGDRRFYTEFVRQLRGWLAANPPLQGVNWASMLEAGFRTISWVWALHFFAGAAVNDNADDGDEPWIVDLLVGLDLQLAHICDNMSRYFSPNTHLTGEALALYVAGLALPELVTSEHYGSVGRSVLLQEIDRQIAADGGHAELSPHYHRYTTDFYLLALSIARVTRDAAAPRFEAAGRRLALYLRTIADDTGRLPLIGDDDGGKLFPMCPRPPWDTSDSLAAAAVLLGDPRLAVGAIPEEVFWLCEPGAIAARGLPGGPWPSTALPASGYYVSRTPQGDHLTFDAGQLGFLNGGHAHADALAAVLTIAGRPLLVDPGTATYTMDPALRDLFRSTAMHNTVVVNGRGQSESSGPFNWRTRTDAQINAWQSGDGFDYAEGQHDGYAPFRHVRGILALHGVGWVVVDHVFPAGLSENNDEAYGPARVEAFWHLSPEWSASPDTSRRVVLRHCDGTSLTVASSAPLRPLAVEEAHGLDAFAPIYGHVEQAVCLRTECAGGSLRSFATFIPADSDVSDGATVESVDLVDVPGTGRRGAAYRLTWYGHEVIILSAVEPEADPGALWGTAQVRSNARFAFLSVSGAGKTREILIDGDRLERSATVASTVHS